MPMNVNCIFAHGDVCEHAAVPKRWFSGALCVLYVPNTDPRVRNVCLLQQEHKKPEASPPPPLRNWE